MRKAGKVWKMNKSVEATGKTIDAAIASALTQLGMDRDQVTVEVLENPKSGFLGFGASPAKVLVTHSFELGIEEKTQEFLSGLLSRMGSQANVSINKRDDTTYDVRLVGDNLGELIGRRGDTLDAIQQLTNYSVNRGAQKRVRINVDAENYRSKREESLQHLAQKVAAKVVKNRKNVTLEAMNAYERHVIHAELQDYEDVTTYSTGTEPNRRIVVAYSKYKSVPSEK